MHPDERTSTTYREVLELLARYYEGLYRLDIDLLREVFSPSARYATIRDGELLELGLDEYLTIVEQREPPSEQDAPYDYELASIRIAGPHTALAEVRCSLFGYDYTDLLSLLRIDGRWRIQSKVFEGVPAP